MTVVSFVRHYADRMELHEARGELRPRLQLPAPTYSDREYEEVFNEARSVLGFEGLEPKYEDGKTKLLAPEGYMFRVTGAFTLFPDGNDITWGYGPPSNSYEQWRRQNQHELQALEDGGLSPEGAEQEVAAWEEGNFTSEPPNLHHFHGGAITLGFNGATWGAMKNVGSKTGRSSDNEPASVKVTLEGFRHRWYEQARRFIKLPNSPNDRLLTEYEYGEPGKIPCWSGAYAQGDIEHLHIELVPIDDGEGDTFSPPMNRVWVPEKVRWAAFNDYPDLIDQGSDYGNRSNYGVAMRLLGGLASAMSGREDNAFDVIAARSDLAVIDSPMFASMDTAMLVELVEKMIANLNAKEPVYDDRTDERRERAEEDLERLKKQLVVVTDTDQSIHAIVREVGQSDDWLVKHAGYMNLMLDF